MLGYNQTPTCEHPPTHPTLWLQTSHDQSTMTLLNLLTKTVPQQEDCMQNVEHSQNYQQLVEQGPDEPGLREGDDGQGVHHQASQAENGLDTVSTIA